MGQHAIGVAGEQRQQLELLRRQPDLVVSAQDATTIVVDREIGHLAHAAVSGSSASKTRRSATRMRASSSSGPNGFVT